MEREYYAAINAIQSHHSTQVLDSETPLEGKSDNMWQSDISQNTPSSDIEMRTKVQEKTF